MLRSIIRQAAKPLARNNLTRRTLYSSPASFSDAIFVVKKRKKRIDMYLTFLNIQIISIIHTAPRYSRKQCQHSFRIHRG